MTHAGMTRIDHPVAFPIPGSAGEEQKTMRISGYIVSSCVMLSGMIGLGPVQGQGIPASERVMQLVRAHESTLGLIHQFDVQLEGWLQPLLVAPAGTPAVPGGTTRWSRKDNLERIRHASYRRRDGFGEIMGVSFEDQFNDGKERRVLVGWNPERPVPLTPLNQNGVSCYMEGETGQRMAVSDPSPSLLLSFRDLTVVDESRLSLCDLVKRAKAVEVRDGPGQGGGPDDRLLCLRIWREINNEVEEKSGAYFDIFLDPRVGMLARRLVNHHDRYAWSANETLPWVEWVYEVKTFHDAGGGAFFPTESEMHVYRCDRKEPTVIIQHKAKTVIVNQALPSDALDFRFPENAQVVTEEGGKRTVHVWGPDNQPVRTVTKPGEILAVQREFEVRGSLQTPGVGYWVWTAVGVGVLLVAAPLVLRHRRRRAAS